MKQQFFLLVIALVCQGGSLELCPSFTSSVEEGRAVCPGEGLTYNCTIFDNASLVPSTFWSANGLDLKADRAQQKTDTCGPFTVQFAEEYGDCYIFTLIVNASLEVNGTVIQCRHNGTSVGTTTVLVTVPPPPPTGVSVANCTGDSVTLEWKGPTDTDSPVTSYVLSATPTVEDCNTTCNTSAARYTFTGLLPGENYSVTVRADTCDGNLQGETSSPLKLSVDGIGSFAVEVCRVYDANNMLSIIDVTWNSLCQPFDSYTVTLTGDGVHMSTEAQCCSANFTISTDSVSSYSVQVSGAGVSSPVIAGISAANDQLSVEIESNCIAVIATCSFLSGFTGSAYCRVDYGTSPDSLEYSATSQQMGSAGESVTVELTEASGFSTTYYYQAAPSGDTPLVKMKGMFTTISEEDCEIITGPPDEGGSGIAVIFGKILGGMGICLIIVFLWKKGPVKRWTKGLLTKFLKAIGRSDTAPQLGEINLECGTTVDESSSEGTEDNSKQELTAASPRRLPPKPQASRSKENPPNNDKQEECKTTAAFNSGEEEDSDHERPDAMKVMNEELETCAPETGSGGSDSRDSLVYNKADLPSLEVLKKIGLQKISKL